MLNVGEHVQRDPDALGDAVQRALCLQVEHLAAAFEHGVGKPRRERDLDARVVGLGDLHEAAAAQRLLPGRRDLA